MGSLVKVLMYRKFQKKQKASNIELIFGSVKLFKGVKEIIAEETAGMSFEELKKYLSTNLEKRKQERRRVDHIRKFEHNYDSSNLQNY